MVPERHRRLHRPSNLRAGPRDRRRRPARRVPRVDRRAAGPLPVPQAGRSPARSPRPRINLDYALAARRNCFEGNETLAEHCRARAATYAAGDIWGCVGALVLRPLVHTDSVTYITDGEDASGPARLDDAGTSSTPADSDAVGGGAFSVPAGWRRPGRRGRLTTSKLAVPSNVSPSTARRNGPSREDGQRRHPLPRGTAGSAATGRRGRRARSGSARSAGRRGRGARRADRRRGARATTDRSPPGRRSQLPIQPSHTWRRASVQLELQRLHPGQFTGERHDEGQPLAEATLQGLAGIDHLGVPAEAQRVHERALELLVAADDDTEIHVRDGAGADGRDGVGDLVETQVAGEVVERARRHGDEDDVAGVGHLSGRAERSVAAGGSDGDELATLDRAVTDEHLDQVVAVPELADVGRREAFAQVVDRVGRPRGTGAGVHGDAHPGPVRRRAGVRDRRRAAGGRRRRPSGRAGSTTLRIQSAAATEPATAMGTRGRRRRRTRRRTYPRPALLTLAARPSVGRPSTLSADDDPRRARSVHRQPIATFELATPDDVDAAVARAEPRLARLEGGDDARPGAPVAAVRRRRGRPRRRARRDGVRATSASRSAAPDGRPARSPRRCTTTPGASTSTPARRCRGPMG